MFGNYELYEGLSFVPVFIGLFAMSELLVQSKNVAHVVEAIGIQDEPNVRGFLASLHEAGVRYAEA